jgi:multiple sugar transport system substrate-binding protein
VRLGGIARGCVAILLPLICLCGCQQAAPQRRVTVWAMGREGEVLAQLLPEFSRLHPDVRVQLQQMPVTAAHQKLLTAFAGDVTPDVCGLGNTWIPEFVALDALEPLAPRLALSRSVVAEDYFPGIWDTNIVAGRQYGVPWYIDTRLLFYRRDLLARAGFASPPATWQEWARMLAAIKARVGPERYGVLLPLNEFEPLLVLALQQSEPPLREEGRYGNFRSAGFRRALAFYSEMFARQWAPAVDNTQIANVWDELGRGYYSFYISGPWNIGEFQRRLPPQLQDTWMTAPMPGPEGPGASVAGGSSLVIFRRSRHKDDAWQLIEFLSSPAIQRRFYELTGDLPPRRSTWAAPELAGNVYARAFREQLERVKPTPTVPEWERIVTAMQVMAGRVVHGDESIEAGTAALDHEVDGILEKRRWLLSRGVTP